MAIATTETFPQYAGELYMFGNYSNPFLASLGEAGRIVNNFDFALSSSYTLASGVQQAITETGSITAPTIFENYTRDQDVNSCQIIQKYVRTSNKLLSSYNQIVGNASDYLSVDGGNAITNVHEHNIQATLKQVYRDLNYSCWNGSYVRSTAANVAAKTRGLVEAVTTNATTAGVTMANMTKAIIDSHLAGMADDGIDMTGVVIWVGSEAKIKLSNLYSLNLQTQPRDRVVGGVNVQTLITDFGEFPIVYDFDVPAKSIYFINMPMCSNVWCPVPMRGALYYEDKSDAAAGMTGMIYGQWGIDYGAEEMHGVIKTS